MTAASLLRDLTAFSMQIALVALGVAVLLKLVRIPAGARYLGLRLALVAALVVPWLLRSPELQAPTVAPGAQVLDAPVSRAAAIPSASLSRAVVAVPVESKVAGVPWIEVGFGALLVGVVARVVWLGMGVLRLLRLKRGGVVVDAPEYSELQQRLGTRATIAQVPTLSQPATFGIRPPQVLLPDALTEAPASLRRAVVTHELFHVRRRDWLAVLGEEAVRTALWFHPGIHWLIAQIQLAREEIVDELTVRATGDRRTYVEALLSFADTPGLGPAPAFAHRRQLFHRILSVSKEKVMSTPRIVSSAIALMVAVSGVSWYASTVFPVVKAAKTATAPSALLTAANASTHTAPAVVSGGSVEIRDSGTALRASELRLEQRGKSVAVYPVTPENPIPRRTRVVAIAWPAQLADIPTAVSILVTVDRNGAVTSIDRDDCRSGRNDLSACATAFDAVAAAVRQWRYDRPAQAPLQFHVDVTYRPGTEPSVSQAGERAPDWMEYLRATQDSLRVLAAQVGRGDDRVATADFDKARRAISDCTLARSELATGPRWANACARSSSRNCADTSANCAPPFALEGSPQLKSPSGRAPIRVTPPMTPPTAVKTVKPQYSEEAKQARAQGTVTVEVLVDEKGHVADARVLKSIPLLDKSALDAAKQWEFTPTLMNGEPVPLLLQLEMNFTLK